MQIWLIPNRWDRGNESRDCRYLRKYYDNIAFVLFAFYNHNSEMSRESGLSGQMPQPIGTMIAKERRHPDDIRVPPKYTFVSYGFVNRNRSRFAQRLAMNSS